MTLRAKDIMVNNFDTVYEEAPVEDAIKMILNGQVRPSGHKTISLMVLDKFQRFVGIITMYDVLYHLRPSVLNYGINGEELPWEGELNRCFKELQGKKVRQVMSAHIVGASPDEHIMVLLDRMIKNKYRRLPILENERPIGIVYLSEIYHHLFAGRWG
ncbi:MAG: CBS domain-containing protein [Desulfosudaceae bacterium]